jgi:hypothetical protein
MPKLNRHRLAPSPRRPVVPKGKRPKVTGGPRFMIDPLRPFETVTIVGPRSAPRPRPGKP